MVNTTYEGDGKGRATVWSCTALLARVSLFQSKWKEAHHYADTTIVNSGCKLEPNFLDIWSVKNHNGVESLIEVQTKAETGKFWVTPFLPSAVDAARVWKTFLVMMQKILWMVGAGELRLVTWKTAIYLRKMKSDAAALSLCVVILYMVMMC